MKKEAEEHADEDAKKKELIETRNLADQLIYTAEKSLRDHADKIDETTKTEINQKIAALKEIKDKDEKTAIETATQDLSTSLQKIGEILQKASSENKTQEAPKEGEESVRDAEVTKDEHTDETK